MLKLESYQSFVQKKIHTTIPLYQKMLAKELPVETIRVYSSELFDQTTARLTESPRLTAEQWNEWKDKQPEKWIDKHGDAVLVAIIGAISTIVAAVIGILN